MQNAKAAGSRDNRPNFGHRRHLLCVDENLQQNINDRALNAKSKQGIFLYANKQQALRLAFAFSAFTCLLSLQQQSKRDSGSLQLDWVAARRERLLFLVLH
jgi:hypothetical protein